MKILKYKKKKDNKYEIVFDDTSIIALYEDVILEYNLLIKKDIDKKELDNIIKRNAFYECYYKALKLIKTRLRSVYEIRKKLEKEFLLEDIDNVINKLLEQGYLNDLFYANSYLNNQLITTYHGPRRIYNDLKKQGIEDNIINEVLLSYDNKVQIDKVSKIIDRMIKSNKNKSNNYLKRKIYNDLINNGFSKEVIDKVISIKEFNSDEDIKNKEYEKIKSKLSKKYEGKELEYKIKEQMIRKGFYI